MKLIKKTICWIMVMAVLALSACAPDGERESTQTEPASAATKATSTTAPTREPCEARTYAPSVSPETMPFEKTMPKKDWVTVFISYRDYHEGEFCTTVDALEAAGYRVVVVSTQAGNAKSSCGSSVAVDKTVVQVDDVGLGIVISGGTGVVGEWENEALIVLVRQANEDGLMVAAICAGPGVLGNAGVLEGKQASWYNGPNTNRVMKSAGCMRSKNPVTVDGNVITGENPAAAQAFAQAITAYLNER